MEYNPYIPPSITIVYKGDGDSATRIITKNIDGFGDVYNLDESSIVNMTLDDNKVSFDDFEVVNIGEYGAVGNVYTYVFGDTNEHVLKIWSTTTTMFKFSVRVSRGPDFSTAVDFTSIKSIRISDTITSIPWGNFYGCSGLLNISILNSVTSIGESAFRECTNLTSITIPNSVTTIGEDAFNSCYFTAANFVNNSSLDEASNSYWGATIIDSEVDGLCIKDNSAIKYRGTSNIVVIPNTVTSIGEDAFSGCTSLTSVTIPNGVTSIGEYAFDSCNSLTSIVIPNSVTYMGWGAFADCSNLAMIDVESGNTTYDSRDNCNAIIETATNTLMIGCQNTTIPNTVTSIGESAFFDCTKLTSITIPNSVTSIGEYAFSDCTKLTSVTVEASTPPSLGSDAFYNNASGRKIYVPSESVAAYKSPSGWITYASDIEAIQQ